MPGKPNGAQAVDLPQVSAEPTRVEDVPLNEVPVPLQLLVRARDDRNVPIPGVVWVDPATVVAEFVRSHRSFVDYTYLDWDVWAACVNQHRCSYCKHPLDYYLYFVGHQDEVYSRVFVNPAMHDACAHYLLQVYPTVAMPRMRDAPRASGGTLPSRLGVYKARDYKVIGPPGHEITTTPKYRVRAGTQVGHTLWVEYDRDAMAEFNAREMLFYAPSDKAS